MMAAQKQEQYSSPALAEEITAHSAEVEVGAASTIRALCLSSGASRRPALLRGRGGQ
jgi:hypothetical protein